VEHRGHHQNVEDIRMVAGGGEPGVQLRSLPGSGGSRRELGVRPDLPAAGRGSPADEVAISEAETEIGYYQGEGLLLEDVLREQVLLATPVRALCREDCKGLCPLCGRNLNVEQCHCEQHVSDPRWDALNEIRKSCKARIPVAGPVRRPRLMLRGKSCLIRNGATRRRAPPSAALTII